MSNTDFDRSLMHSGFFIPFVCFSSISTATSRDYMGDSTARMLCFVRLEECFLCLAERVGPGWNRNSEQKFQLMLCRDFTQFSLGYEIK